MQLGQVRNWLEGPVPNLGLGEPSSRVPGKVRDVGTGSRIIKTQSPYLRYFPHHSWAMLPGNLPPATPRGQKFSPALSPYRFELHVSRPNYSA